MGVKNMSSKDISTGKNYKNWVEGHCYGKDGADTYAWSEGIAP